MRRALAFPRMPNLPTSRQVRDSTPASAKPRAADRRSLARAFQTFTQAAGSLEKSYGQLQNEVSRLRADLERTNAELSHSLEENARARAFLSQVLAGLPCGVLVSDSQGRVQMLNSEARRLLELDPEGLPDNDPPSSEVLNKLLSEVSAGPCFAEEEWSPDPPPGNLVLAISTAKVEISREEESETIWILRDITDQKRLAVEREEGRRAHALAEIAAVLAHEIRNPLGSMELFTGLLANATARMPETHPWVMHLQAGLRSLAATVNNVLQFHGKPCEELLPTRLDRLLRDTVEFLGPLARRQGLTIVMDDLIGGVMVSADPQRLQQVFFNLALNALWATAEGGTLTVRVRWAAHLPRGLVRIDFQDDGTGIEPDMLEAIFKPGFTTKAGSPGLGLSVCKRVIEQHGGSICVESQVGRGSTFTIFLPASGGTQ
jgi:two-component system, sensor histidine kinase FlrB